MKSHSRWLMFHRGTWLFVGLIVCFATASAQTEYRAEIFGSIGMSESIAILRPPDRRFNVGGGVGFRPFPAERSPLLRMLGLEFEANGSRVATGSGPVIQSHFTGNLLLHAPISRVEPYLLLGGGVSYQRAIQNVWDVGVGAKVFVSPNISVRPELRVFGIEYPDSAVRISVGVGYHW